MKKVAIYSRVSTQDQSVEQQMRVLRDYCVKMEYVIVEEFMDIGISAFKKHRPAYQNVLESARQRKFDIILVFKLDRWGRSLREIINSMDMLKRYGVGFVSYSEKEFDTTSSVGELMFNIVACFANFERTLISERTKLKLQYLKSQGMVLGRPRKIQPQRMMELRAQGLSLRQIGRELGCDRSSVSKALKLSKVMAGVS